MILKFLQGGAISAPLVSYLPIMPTAGESKKTSPEKDSEDLTDKDLLEMLSKMDGLPSDMTVLTQTLQNFYLDKYYGRHNTSSITSKYLLILKDLKVAGFNKAEYDSAYKAASETGAINEIAIDERGRIFCANLNTGDFKLLTAEQLTQLDGYTALTNSELLHYRANDPTMANKNSILKVVKSGVSMKDINDTIMNIIDSLGTGQNTDEGFFKSDQLIQGISDFALAILNSSGIGTIGGLYKYKLLTKDLAERASKAIDYLYRTMPENMKTLLKIKSGDNSEIGAKLLMQTLVASQLDLTLDFSIDTPIEKGSSTGGSTPSDVSSDIEHNPVMAFAIGTGNTTNIRMNIGSSIGFNVLGRESILVSKTGEPIGANDTLQDVTKSAYAPILDVNNATFGGVKINMNLSNLFLLDSSTIIGMDLPVDEEALAQGIIRPNLELTRRIESAEQEIRENNITELSEKDAIYLKYELPERFKNENGHYDLSSIPYRRFGRITGTLDAAALPEDAEVDGTVFEIEDGNRIDNIERIFKNKDKDYSLSGGWFGVDLYEGAIYIPVKEDVVSATLGMGSYVSVGDAMSMKERQHQVQIENERLEKIKGYKRALSLSTLE